METRTGLVDPEILVQRYYERPTLELKEALLSQYRVTVERIARRFAGVEPYEDLVQVGFMGLLNAISKFDPQAGVRFNTYATHLITGEVKHYLRDRSQIIRHPAWLQELRHKVNRTQLRLQAELGRLPSQDEVAQACGVSITSVYEVASTAESLRVASYDAAVPGDDDSTEIDQMAASCDDQISVEERVVLENAMDQLRDLEREVVMMFHFDSLSQTEIAKQLGISGNYVSHILRQSMSKLRRILATEEVSDRKLKKQLNICDEELVHAKVGAYKEQYFRQRLDEEAHRAGSEETELAVVLIQFSGLEGLASFYGQEAVYDYLAEAADFIRGHVRRLDVVCCFGNRGFGVILPYTGVTVEVVRQRLEAKFAPYLHSRRGPSGQLGVSISSAIFGVDGKRGADLLAVAESRLGAPDVEAAA